ncbi:MAG: type VII toxin-antitoxin system HepT family RNase toxin [Thiobacillus sp.]
MRLDLYQAETARIATEQSALLAQAKQRLADGLALSPLEQSGVLHALQILIENAIGKAKQLLKAQNEPVPVSAYDAFAALARRETITQDQLSAWNAIIGLRNRIVHDYMNIDMQRVQELVAMGHHEFVTAFLLRPIST